MFDKLEDLLVRLEEILSELNEPGVANDPARFQKLMKEQSELQPIVDAYKEYKACQQTVEESLMMLDEESDEEMREMLKEELADAKSRIEELETELKILLLPKDPNDSKNVIVEIRAGAGGDEAALFAAEIYRMYVKYAESRRWKTELMSLNENGIGGFKEVTFMINGAGAYSRLKYESGVHRVQRVPETESGGRIHTSTITVAIMPEAEEIDFQLDLNDCKFDVFRASGNGGQCVNTTAGKINVADCQDPNHTNPTENMIPTKLPPTLWATFQIDILVPRSFKENQCVITRPLGGQPIPWNQPIKNWVINMTTIEETPALVPKNNVTSADNTNPNGKNLRALLRSETPPIKNFDIP